MADVNNLAKLQYVLENAENVMPAGKTNAYVVFENGKNRPAKTVLYEKDIGEKAYYAIQTAVDTKNKTLYIVTAFIGEKGYKKGASLSSGEKILEETSENATAISPATNIPTTSENVNTQSSLESK